jgi:hypothetical protein
LGVATPSPLPSDSFFSNPGQNDEGGWASDIDPALLRSHPDRRRRELSIEFYLHGGCTKQVTLELLGVLSLSERYDSLLMWSHYADSHRGIALGLRTDHRFFRKRDTRRIVMPSSTPIMGEPKNEFRQIPPLCKIMYGSERVTMLRLDPREVIASASLEVFDYAEFLFKADAWRYEQEWRLFRRLSNNCSWDTQIDRRVQRSAGFFSHRLERTDSFGHTICLFDIPSDCIAEIVLGINVSIEDRRQVAETLLDDPALKHVRLRVARSTASRYEIEAVDVEPRALLSSIARESYRREERVRVDLREAFSRLSADRLHELAALVSATIFRSPGIPAEVLSSAIHEAIALTQSVDAGTGE